MRVRFLSVDHLKNEIVRVSKRFPLTVFIVSLLTALFLYIIAEKIELDHTRLGELIMILILGIPLSLAFHLLAENPPAWIKIDAKFIPSISLIPLIAFYFWKVGHHGDSDLIRYFHWALYCHLLVAFAPFVKRTDSPGFWNYNYNLFIGFLVSRFFGLFLWGGLSAAVATVNSLFEMKINEKPYFYLAVLCLVFSSSLHFLALVPTQMDDQESEPKLLKVFCQYVLVPLNAAYILILYSYMIKILFTGVWPRGVVSMLVAGVAILGVFALLMMNTFFKRSENAWMKRFQTGYYISIVPLLLMGIVSIGIRINQYQMTERRYILIILSLWLMGISLYSLLSKQKKIILIPISLFVLAVITSFGPWGFYQVSLNSQRSRLDEALKKVGALQGDHLVAVKNEIARTDAEEIRDTMAYLASDYGGTSLPNYFPLDERKALTKDNDRYDRYAIRGRVLKLMAKYFVLPKKLDETGYYRTTEAPNYSYYSSGASGVIGDDQVIIHVMEGLGHYENEHRKLKLSFVVNKATGTAVLKNNEKEILTWELKPLLDDLKPSGSQPNNLIWSQKNEVVEVYFILRSINGNLEAGDDSLFSILGDLVVRFKK